MPRSQLLLQTQPPATFLLSSAILSLSKEVQAFPSRSPFLQAHIQAVKVGNREPPLTQHRPGVLQHLHWQNYLQPHHCD